MKSFLTLILSLLCLSAFSQADYQYLNVQRRFTLANRTVKGISNDTAWLVGSADSLVTQYAVQGYIANNFSRGGSFAYNFNPEQFIQNGQDISIRFPQDPGEPLFTGSPAFNFTQQHLDFLDSLMLAVGQDTYLDDRDFYYSSDTLHPIRWKAFTLTTTGSGAANWDSANRHLNIPVSSGGSGSSSPYHLPYNGDTTFYLAGDTSLRKLPAVKSAAYKLPYNGDSTFYLAGDSTLHPLPPTPPPGDSIDYSFTSMTTIYNEAGPGEYTITTSGVAANKDNLTFPFRQLKALDIGGWSNGDYVSFKNTGSANSTAYTFLRGFVRLKQTVPIIQSLSFQFYKNGTPVSQVLSMVNYGLNKSKANVYQNITIPMSAFQFTSNDFDEVRLIFGGGSSADGLYLDLFQFQNATVNENTYVTDLFKQAGTDSVYKVLGGQNVFAFRDSAGVAVDTTSLSNRINLKLSSTDTLSLSSRINQKLSPADTISLSSRINLKLNSSDTASLSNRINLKLNIADTLNKWAAKTHTHAESDVTNLLSDLAGKEPTITAGTTSQYWRGDKTWQTLNTDAVTEATNKYYTDTRARAAITLTTTGTSGAATYNSTTGVLNVPQYATTVGTITWLGTTYNINSGNNVTLPAPSTTQVTEGTNLYYTDARARAAISVTGSGGSYNSSTGIITLTGGSGGGSPAGASGAVQINKNGSFGSATSFVYDTLNNSLGIGTATPATTSLLDLTSTSKGFLPPRMTTTQRDAIVSPATGLVIYNTTTSTVDTYTGSVWVNLNISALSGLNIVGGASNSYDANDQQGVTHTTNGVAKNNVYAIVNTASGKIYHIKVALDGTFSLLERTAGSVFFKYTPSATIPLSMPSAVSVGELTAGSGVYVGGGNISTNNGLEINKAGGEMYLSAFNRTTSPLYNTLNLRAGKFTFTTGNAIFGGTTDVTSSVLTAVSTTKGAIPFPKMTAAQRTAIASPVAGLHVYQTDETEGVYVYKSTGWQFAY